MKFLLLFIAMFVCAVISQTPQQCFTDSNPLQGYITSYETTAFNINLIENGNIKKQSLSMTGTISMNFIDKTLFNIFNVINQDGTSVDIQIYQFGQNSTEYTVVDSKCYLKTMSTPFPDSLQVKLLENNSTIGGVQVSKFQVLDLGSVGNAEQVLYVNAQNCDFIYTAIKNTDSYGSSLTNFQDFSQSIVTSQLPSVCFNVVN